MMEKKYCAIYLSGTGNTKFCLEKFVKLLDENAPVFAIEDEAALSVLKNYEYIVLGYPVQYSNAPKMVRDFIVRNAALWKGKKIFCLATMGAFSGDGAGCSARLLKKCGATVLGGLHLKMPDSVCDSKLLKKSKEEKIELIRRTEKNIERAILRIRSGKYPQNGLGLLPHLVGLFGQRLWFYGKTKNYSAKLKIDKTRCVGCGVCVRVCPMQNLILENQVAEPNGKCTMCYRCISGCPQQAITLVGKKVVEQYRLENFIS